jgi:cell wall-associated NlpC family hydrolase
VFAYNHSTTYVSGVLALASRYAAAGGSDPTLASEVGLGSVIVKDVEAYLGTPYVWGGENPKVGFDCSGLVQWVYAKAGLSLPRVAQDQYNAGPLVASGVPLEPGDVVFFGTPRAITHDGIYIGNGMMVDAPHTGTLVRVESSQWPDYVGATRPVAVPVNS